MRVPGWNWTAVGVVVTVLGLLLAGSYGAGFIEAQLDVMWTTIRAFDERLLTLGHALVEHLAGHGE